MEAFEEPIMYYLTHAGGVFLVPQCAIVEGNGEARRCHDFVALDFRKQEVQIVEVKTAPAQRLRGFVRTLLDRKAAWYDPLRAKLEQEHVVVARDWRVVARIFVRRDAVEYVRQGIAGADDVTIEGIEDITFSWTWTWSRHDG
jgi:hypothetical protein